jgi:hypothetical protein
MRNEAQVEENFHQFNFETHKEKEMVDFRKWFPVLAIVAVMFTLTAPSASAQTVGPAFSCTANAGVPPVVRAEGITELTGDVILNCTGGQPAGQGGNAPMRCRW